MENGESMSKREQKKLNQIIKLFSEKEPKPRKKRVKNEKYIKISPNCDTTQQSVRQGVQRADLTSQDYDSELKCQKIISQIAQETMNQTGSRQKISAYKAQDCAKIKFNGQIIKQNEKESLFDYLIQYQYNQMEKKFEKSSINFRSFLLNVRGNDIKTFKSPSKQIFLKINEKNTQIIGQSPFSKIHQKYKDDIMKLLQK